MGKRKKVEIPAIEELPREQEDAETTEQISKRLKISKQKALDIIHRYADLGQLRCAHVPGINVSGIRCLHTVYWLEVK